MDHVSRFLSHQFVTWYLRSISKTKIVKFFCPCMSEHVIYIKNVTNVTQTLHQNVTNVTKQNIASKEILTIEFHTKYIRQAGHTDLIQRKSGNFRITSKFCYFLKEKCLKLMSVESAIFCMCRTIDLELICIWIGYVILHALREKYL